MVNLNETVALNLYMYLSGKEDVNPVLNQLMLQLEKELYSIYSVAELEKFRDEYLKKGVI